MPKQEFHITDFSGGLNCYSDARDIKDTEFSQNWNASFDKYGVIRFTGAGKEYITNHPHVNTGFVPGGGLFSYSTDYIENIISSDFNGGFFGGDLKCKIAAYGGGTEITLRDLGPNDPRYKGMQVADTFNDMLLHIYAGPGKGQVRRIDDYGDAGTRVCDIDTAFGLTDIAGNITEVLGDGQKIKAVAKIEINNTISDAEDHAGEGQSPSHLLGEQSLCGNGTPEQFANDFQRGTWSTLKVTDRDGKTIQLHFIHGNHISDTSFTGNIETDISTNIKLLKDDYVAQSGNIFTPGDKHYLIKGNVAAATIVDYLVTAINDADTANTCNVAATDETTVLALEAEAGDGLSNVEYIGFYTNRVGYYSSGFHGNPYSPDKTLNIFQPFNKGLGGPNKNIIAKVKVASHTLNVGEWVTIAGTTNYNGTHRVEWVYDDYFFINSTQGTNETSITATFTSIPTTASYYKIYNWNVKSSADVATTAWNNIASSSSMLFSNKHPGADDAAANATHFKQEISSPEIPGYGISDNIYRYQNTFLCASGEPASAGVSQNTTVDLGYIEQSGLDLRPGESYRLSFDMNCLTTFKMWTADGADADILPGVLLYSKTAGDGNAQDYVLMSDNQWIKSNEPVTNGGIKPFTNVVLNGDFKYNMGTTYDDDNEPTLQDWTVEPTTAGSIDFSLHENTDKNHIAYQEAGGWVDDNGHIVKHSGAGDKNGGSVLELRSNNNMPEGSGSSHRTRYMHQDLDLDGNCWYDVYIQWDAAKSYRGTKSSALYLDLENQSPTDSYFTQYDSIVGGWKIFYRGNRIDSQFLKHQRVVFSHMQEYYTDNGTSDRFRFEYFRFFVPPMSTEATARSVKLKISGYFRGGPETQVFISAISVKKSFPDVVHIANQAPIDQEKRPRLPIIGTPKADSTISPYDAIFNGEQFFNEWQTYTLNFTIPKDAYDKRDYILRLYAGRFGYTTTLSNGESNTNSPYPNQQAVCFDNIKLTQKASSRGQDIILLSDNIKASISESYVGNIIPAQSKIHKYVVDNLLWDKEFIVWSHGDADPIYSYVNGILQISDANFNSDNNNLFFNFYYNRPVFDNYNTDGFITTEDPVNFLGAIYSTEVKNVEFKTIHLNGCHEHTWRGYQATLSDVPDGVVSPTNWHYMHFDWKVALDGYYHTDSEGNFGGADISKWLENIPIKYVDSITSAAPTVSWFRLLTALTNANSAHTQFNFGGIGSESNTSNIATTQKHVFNNPLYLPISGWEDSETNGYTGMIDETLPEYAFTVDANPYYLYPTDGGDFGYGKKGGNNMTAALEFQETNYIGTNFYLNPGEEGGPLYAANMSFELLLVFRANDWAEALGEDYSTSDNAKMLLDTPIPRIRATLIKLEDEVNIDTNFLDDLFAGGAVDLNNEVASEILPKTSKSIREKQEEGNDSLFGFHPADSNRPYVHGHIPYRFQLNLPYTSTGGLSPITSKDNIVLKLEILDPTDNINYLEAFIGTDPKGSNHGELDRPHGLGYNFNTWNMNFYSPEWHKNNLISGVSESDIKVNLDFRVPIDSMGQENLDSSESWTDRVFQVGVSTVNIFDEESIIKVDDTNNIGENVKINVGEAPRLCVVGSEIIFHNPIIKKVNIYMKDNESDIWYLQASIDTFKGKIKSSTTGQEFDYVLKDVNVDSSTAVIWEIHEKYMLNFNEVDSYESQSLIRQEDALKKSTLQCRYKTSVHCNNRLYVGNIKQEGKVYGDRMIKTPIGKYNIFPKSNYIDVAIHDGDEITALAYFKDKILQFKKRKVFVINVAGDYEYLEDTFDSVGISRLCQVVTTPNGICWVNSGGCFLYDGKKLDNLIANKIGTESFQSNPVGVAYNYWNISSTDQPSIGYVGSSQKLIIAINVGDKNDTTSRAISSGIPEAYQYDFQSKGWTFVFKKLTATQGTVSIPTVQGHLSNFINDKNNELLYYATSASGDIASAPQNDFNAIYKWDDASTRSEDSGNVGDMFYLRTKDYDFGSPGVRKKIYKVYVTFKTHDDTDESDGYQHSKVNVFYGKDGVAAISGNTFSDSTSSNYSASNGLYAADSSTGWNVAELKPSASVNNVYSFNLLFLCAASRIANRFEINDITIVYRIKNVK